MHGTFRNFRFLAAAWAVLLFTALPVQAQTEANLRVLILNSYDESTAPYARVRTAFMTELQGRSPAPIAFWQFDLQERGAEEGASQALKAELLQSRYVEAPPDLVLAIGPPATAFWLAHRDAISAGTPFIGAGGQEALAQMEFRPGDAVVATPVSFADRVEDILYLLPETSHVVVVFGTSDHERRLANGARMELEGTFDGLTFDYTNDLGLRELQDRLGSLSPGSAILYGLFDSDVNGILMHGHAGLELVRAASKVPVFGLYEDQLGLGIVGGRLMRLEQIGREIAAKAERALHERPMEIDWTVVELSEPVYDWRELGVWDIDLDGLPADSIIRFRPSPPWEQYGGWVLLTALVIAAQTLLVSALLLQRRRRRLAEQDSASLSRRLITAHEDEHRRIARELHDDLSQRLARLSIDAGYLVSRQGTEAANEVLHNMQPELVRISKDIHDMSYRLHPSLVDDLGIAAALRAECERVRRRTGAAIVEKISDIRDKIPHDTALGIYRIAQAALGNAVTHAQADSIEVTLDHDERMLILTVHDNGVGFDPAAERAGHGLGLSSMRERARLASGSLNIRSRPGQGTTVIAAVPVAGVES